jgi:hypothetical protein
MSDKLLTEAGWKAVLAKNPDKVKDNGLQKALARYEKWPEDATSERRDSLDQVIRLATELKKDKAVSAVPAVVKYLGDVATAAAKARAGIAKDLGKAGMKAVDVQFLVTRWDGVPLNGYVALVQFKTASGAVTLKKDIVGGSAEFRAVSLPPDGALRFMAASRQERELTIHALVPKYNLPGKGTMKFTARQKAGTPIKVRAKSLKEATEKASLKGTAGVEFKVIKVGGEKASESELKKAYEQEVEFEFQQGAPEFDMKQV